MTIDEQDDNPYKFNIKKFEFKKGVAQNPYGPGILPKNLRIKKKHLAHEFYTKLFHWLRETPENVSECSPQAWKITSMDRVICACIVSAMNGDVKCFNTIVDRIAGKPLQHLDIKTTSEGIEGKLESMNQDEFIEKAQIALQRLKEIKHSPIDVTPVPEIADTHDD